MTDSLVCPSEASFSLAFKYVSMAQLLVCTSFSRQSWTDSVFGEQRTAAFYHSKAIDGTCIGAVMLDMEIIFYSIADSRPYRVNQGVVRFEVYL